jgi:hypothetical protein
MEKYTDPQFSYPWISSLWRHLIEVVTNTDTLLEVAVIIALLVACLIARPLKKRFQRILDAQTWRDRVPGRIVSVFLPLSVPFCDSFASGWI